MNESRSASPMWRPLAGVAAAVVVTTTMDANGLFMFSALPLFPLAGLFWYLGRFSRRQIGLTPGTRAGYGWAVVYPLVVPGVLAAAALAAGAVDLTAADWGNTVRKIALISLSTFIVTILTEEGFFRGWLWAALKKAGKGGRGILVWSSVSFSLWHLSAVALDTGFDLPAARIPVFLFNAGLLGLNWGLMRQLSGSVLTASFSHGLWNGLVYVMFGFGEKAGALGIVQTGFYGPEVGVLGLGANALFALFLWRRVMHHHS